MNQTASLQNAYVEVLTHSIFLYSETKSLRKQLKLNEVKGQSPDLPEQTSLRKKKQAKQ